LLQKLGAGAAAVGAAGGADIRKLCPQFVQKAAPGFTSPLQRGQMLNDAG